MSGALVFISGALDFMVAIQGILLGCPSLVDRGICIPESHSTVTIRETILVRLSPPGHCTDSRLEYTTNLSLKEAYLLILELGP